LDEAVCNCRAILAVLEAAEFPFRRHLEIFDNQRGILDEVWMPLPGLMTWPVLTKDSHQRYEPLEKANILRYCMKVFTFSSGNLTGAQMADLLKINLKRIDRLARKEPPPFVASISRSGLNLRKLT
jgi:hypothetical protein